MVLLIAIEPSGRSIRLTKAQWQHIVAEHPDMNNLDLIRRAIEEPDFVVPTKYDAQGVVWHYVYNKSRRQFVFVAIKYLNGEGFVITAYYLRKRP